ncbi:hypothetical protein EG68_09112 [Paragonimus skrjabini miyazakii]|uniref:Gamma-tubulin complex component n=1 Tax=Paragonimus skrjabini miyazakii TaxID=59628 RepID=A0A8S9YKR9_9TREM|nr:hypothetical protein EG68_09112 [Paragonimus skrjabini miyazakii]
MDNGVRGGQTVDLNRLLCKLLNTDYIPKPYEDPLECFGDYLNNFNKAYDFEPRPDAVGRLYTLLHKAGRDIDCIALRKLVAKFYDLAVFTRPSDLFEFFYQVLYLKSSEMFNFSQPKLPHAVIKNGNVSSGFFSDQSSSKPSQLRQSVSSTNLPRGLTSSEVLVQSGHPTVPNLTSLWGPSAIEASKRRVSVGAVNARNSSRSGSRTYINQKTSTIGQAPVTTPEIDILRELVFTLNGVGGNLVKFDQLTDVFRLAPNVCLHPGDADAVRRIAECGWLHDRIRQFITHVQHDRLSGPMLQSLASGLHENLSEYYRLIATIESQLGREHRGAASPTNLPARDDRSDIGGSHTDVNILGSRDLSMETVYSNTQQLTLTRFSLWTQEPRFRLRFLASLCDVCRGKRGGALASEVYAYTLIGDPEIASMMRFMLKNLASTLLHLISLWIYDGQLDDPFQEFFVACNPSVKKERLWHEKYSLRRQMIPTFITGAQASKILLAGKSISFLQHACGEKQNIKSREVIRNSRLKRVESMFEQDFDSSFDRMVSTVYKQTSRYLLETLIDRYHFLNHLHATRQFLLLGQGDFITQLMDLLDHELSKPATQILAHRLSSVLESAIRTTNAQYEQPEILQRLDVRLLDMSTGDTGWDVFSLDYHVDGPLATIFTDDCRLMYLRAFNFLWRAKRMEFVLSNLWRHQILAARLGHGLNADLQPVLHLSELLGAELRHCVQQLQYYINFEASFI